MKAKTITKRALSLVLCVVMLVSCWVFTAPGAGAADASEYAYRLEHADANPVYHIEIDMHILDAGNGFNRAFKGTQTGNPDGWGWDAKDYKDMGGIVIWYKDNNGTAASEKDYSIDFSPNNPKTAYYHSDGSQIENNTMFPNSDSGSRDNWDDKRYTLCLDLSGFPTAYAVYNNNDHMKFSWGWKPDTWTDFEITQIRVSGYDSSVDVTSEAYDSYRPIFTGNIRSASTDGANCSRYYIQQDGTVSIWRPNGFGTEFEGNTENNWVHFSDFAAGQDAMKKGGSFNSAYSKSWEMPYPYLADYNYTRLSDEKNYYPAPEHAVLKEPYAFGKDQYGAQLAGTVTSSFVCLGEKYHDGSAWQNASFSDPSYSFNNQTAEITPLKANGYQYHQFDIRPQTEWVISGQYINVNDATNGMYYGNTKTVLMNYTPQTVTWAHYTDNSEGNTGTLQQPATTVFYGDTPAARTDLPTKYYDNTYHHAGGTFTTTPVTKATTFTMQYASNGEHTLSYSELESTDSNYHVKHLATCSDSCGYSKTENHRYGATSFDFATNGKTATASRTCSDCNHTQEEMVTCTSKEKIPATCFVKGWTTYTATSPFDGDTATDTTDVQDIDASGHSWNPTTFSWSEDGTTATATRVCKNDSSHTETLNATMSHAQKTAPTCTEKGWTTYTATSPFSGESNVKDTNDVQDIPALGHKYGDWTDYGNATQHKRVCANDETHIEYKNHDWSGWQYAAPTADETGVRATVRQKLVDAQYNEETSHYNYCTVCGYTKIESHPPVEQWTIDQEHTYPATCEATGQTTSECPDCHKTKVTSIAATGHSWARWEGCSEEKISGLSDSVPVVFKCQNGCGNYCASTYDKEAQKYNPTEVPGTYEAVVDGAIQIQTPTFNEHEEYFDGEMEPPYQYSDRKASLRVRPSEKEDDTQAMRFSGNINANNIIKEEDNIVPVSFKVNPDKIYDNNELMSLAEIRAKNKADKTAFYDDTVIDFGFVYTQAKYIRSAKETINYDLLTLDYMGKNNPATKQDCRIYRMSVVENNKGNGTLSNNWKGLTDCYNYPTEEAGEEGQYTFNLVINVNVKNYQATYVARTYIIYKYHGDIICVYDQPYIEVDEDTGEDVVRYSHDSVYNQAKKNIDSGKLSDTVVNYLEYKIINRTKDIEGNKRYVKQSFIDWDWNYKLTNFKEIEQQNP